jgi:hypothetical protein
MGKRRRKNVWREDSPRGSHASPDSETPESSSDRVLVNIGRAMFVSLALIAFGFACCAAYLGVTSNPWNFAWAAGVAVVGAWLLWMAIYGPWNDRSASFTHSRWDDDHWFSGFWDWWS